MVVGDLLNFGAAGSAMAGVSAAYFCYPISPGGLLDAAAKFAQAAGDADVHAVVNMAPDLRQTRREE